MFDSEAPGIAIPHKHGGIYLDWIVIWPAALPEEYGRPPKLRIRVPVWMSRISIGLVLFPTSSWNLWRNIWSLKVFRVDYQAVVRITNKSIMFRLKMTGKSWETLAFVLKFYCSTGLNASQHATSHNCHCRASIYFQPVSFWLFNLSNAGNFAGPKTHKDVRLFEIVPSSSTCVTSISTRHDESLWDSRTSIAQRPGIP